MARAFAEVGGKFITVQADSTDVAKAARDLLQKAIDRNARDRELVRALTDAAIKWQRQADALTQPTSELKRFYVEKSRRAIDAAGRILAEGKQ